MTENDMLLGIMERFVDADIDDGLARRIAYPIAGGYHGWTGTARNPMVRMSHEDLVAAIERALQKCIVPALYSRETTS